MHTRLTLALIACLTCAGLSGGALHWDGSNSNEEVIVQVVGIEDPM
jgi:hypothetical protein